MIRTGGALIGHVYFLCFAVVKKVAALVADHFCSFLVLVFCVDGGSGRAICAGRGGGGGWM